MTRRQWLTLVAFTASRAQLTRAAQKPESDSVLQTVTLLIEGMT